MKLRQVFRLSIGARVSNLGAAIATGQAAFPETSLTTKDTEAHRGKLSAEC